MITLKQFLQAIQHGINSGHHFDWQCYGISAYFMEVQAGPGDESNSASIVFDLDNKEVYEASVYDYANHRAYRILNTAHDVFRKEECNKRAVSTAQAWPGIDYTDLEVEEDFLEKMTAIMLNLEYNTDVLVSLEIDQERLYQLMLMAHDADLTLNQYTNKILRAAFEEKQE